MNLQGEGDRRGTASSERFQCIPDGAGRANAPCLGTHAGDGVTG